MDFTKLFTLSLCSLYNNAAVSFKFTNYKNFLNKYCQFNKLGIIVNRLILWSKFLHFYKRKEHAVLGYTEKTSAENEKEKTDPFLALVVDEGKRPKIKIASNLLTHDGLLLPGQFVDIRVPLQVFLLLLSISTKMMTDERRSPGYSVLQLNFHQK